MPMYKIKPLQGLQATAQQGWYCMQAVQVLAFIVLFQIHKDPLRAQTMGSSAVSNGCAAVCALARVSLLPNGPRIQGVGHTV